jgi:hypothetical protein
MAFLWRWGRVRALGVQLAALSAVLAMPVVGSAQQPTNVPDEGYYVSDDPSWEGAVSSEPGYAGAGSGEEVGCGDAVGCGDVCCGDSVCDLGPVYAGSRLWVEADYLMWKLDGNYLPPVVTSSPANTLPANAGVLGLPSTTILAGDEVIGGNWRDGYRIRGGVWLDDCQTIGIGGDYFNTGRDGYDYSRSQDPSLIIARPFYNAETGLQDSQIIAQPGELDGTVNVRAYDELQGAGLNLRHCFWRCCNPCGPSTQVDVLAGYRYYELDSSLGFSEFLTVLPTTTQPLVPGTTIDLHDQFDARNEFHGGEIGFVGRRTCSWWWIDGAAKMAIGSSRRTVTVSGQTINTVPGGGQATFDGGLLTSEVTNIGRYSDSSTVVIPEFRLGLGGQITRNWGVHAGYNVIIWNDVARAAAHLPPGLAVDPRNLPPVTSGGGPDPAFPGIRGSQLLAHGFDFGVEFTY